MRRGIWLSVFLVICLLFVALSASAAGADVACPPVDEAVGEAGPIELEDDPGESDPRALAAQPSGEAPVPNADGAARNDASDFVIVDGVLTKYTGLKNTVVIPDGVTRIGSGVFEGDKNVISVTIPNGVTVIEDKAFYACDGLISVSIPDSVTEIGSYAFSSCKNLAAIRLPESLKSVSPGLFRNCEKLERVTIPGSASSIGAGAFGSCASLKEVVIRAGVESIDDAFNACFALESVSIPASVSQISRTAFNSCDSFVILGEAGSNAEQYAQLIGVPFNAPIITLEEKAIWLHISRARTMAATQKPAAVATGLVWSSSDGNVASVDQNGTIRAIATGKATITVATADGRGRAAQVVVNVPEPSGIKLTADSTDSFTFGKTIQVIASVNTPYANASDASFPVTWTSRNSAVITVENATQMAAGVSTALIRAVGIGSTEIVATTEDGGVGSMLIEVLRPEPTDIDIDQSDPVKMHPGDKITLTATLTPAEAVNSVDWYSQDEDIATVNQKGEVTALKEGTATILVETYNDLEDTIDIVVTARKPTSVKLNKSGTVSLKMGKTLQLKATVKPSDAKTTLTWKTSSSKIAKVSSTGKVTPVKGGTATITVKTANGKKASVKVKVIAPAPKSIKITNGKTASLKVGKKLTLKVKLSPENAESKLTWTTSDKKVAAVSSKGVVTAKKEGTATITVKTANGKKAEITITVI